MREERKTKTRNGQAKIAVVIPTYLHSVYLRTCLLSVASQTVPVKIVVVPVREDKETLLELDRLKPQVEALGTPIRIVVSEVADVFRQMQLGLDQVENSEYLFYLGSDDAILPNYLERMLDVALGSECQNPIVGMSYILTDENLSAKDVRRLHEFDFSEEMHRSMIPDNSLVRTESMRRVGGFFEGKDWGYLNHYALWLRMLKIPDTKVFLLPDLGWLYRQTGTNRSIKRYDTRRKLREHHRRQRELVRFYWPRGPRR